MINELTFKRGNKVGLIACSDGIKHEFSSRIAELINLLSSFGFEVVVADTLMRGFSFFSGSPVQRATELNKMFKNEEIRAIFDISGGDSANQILPYLDYEYIRNNHKPFFGISDLSVILNGLYARTQMVSFHYQIMNLISKHRDEQKKLFYNTFFDEGNELFSFNYEWLRGAYMSGVVIGGNIRCFMKLSGTRFFPDPTNKIIFLESLGGRVNRIASLIAQIQRTGCFDDCSGLILGSFTDLEFHNEFPILEEYVKEVTSRSNVPIIRTSELGHGDNCKGIKIGKRIKL